MKLLNQRRLMNLVRLHGGNHSILRWCREGKQIANSSFQNILDRANRSLMIFMQKIRR